MYVCIMSLKSWGSVYAVYVFSFVWSSKLTYIAGICGKANI